MKFFKKTVLSFIIVFLLTTNIFAAGAELRQAPITSDTTADEFLSYLDWLDNSHNWQTFKFKQLVTTVSNSYYFGITPDELISAVINGELIRLPHNNIDFVYTLLFSALDQFSYYVPPIFNSMWDDPHYKGYGVVIYDTAKNKYIDIESGLYIEEVYIGSPAEKSGLLPGDKIIYVNGIKVENLPLNAVSTLLNVIDGENECTITIQRNNELLEFNLKKDIIPAKELMTSFFPNYSAAKFDITAFTSSTLEGFFEEAAKETHKAGYKNLIVDLRGNGGGVVDYAMNIADSLITQVHPLLTFYAKDDILFMEYFSDEEGYNFDNVYVLVDGNTASSSEALAIALKDLAGAVIVGEKTYGKQVGQVIHSLNDNSSFAVTTIKGYGPLNEDYNTIGILPDYFVENKTEKTSLPEDYMPLTEEQLDLIYNGGDCDAILALEQRYSLLSLLNKEYVDGVYDECLDACIKITKIIQKSETKELDKAFLSFIDSSVENSLDVLIQTEDTQLDFVMNMIKNANE